jgi:hypothetical protein
MLRLIYFLILLLSIPIGLLGQQSFRHKTNFLFINAMKTGQDVRHSLSVLEYMKEKKSYRITQNVDRIVSDLTRATKVLKHLRGVANTISLDLFFDARCRDIVDDKEFYIEKELGGALLSVERASVYADNRLRYVLDDPGKFETSRLQVVKALEEYRRFADNLRDDSNAAISLLLDCNVREDAFDCNEITGLLNKAGTVISFVDESSTNSDWFKAMAVFEHYKEYYALVVLKERAYIFCDLPERVAKEIIPKLESERDFESFYHRELKEHTCECN